MFLSGLEIASRMFLPGLESSETPEPAGKVLEPEFFPTMSNEIRIAAQLRARTQVLYMTLQQGFAKKTMGCVVDARLQPGIASVRDSTRQASDWNDTNEDGYLKT